MTADAPRAARSLAEVHRFLMVEPCPACHQGRRVATSTAIDEEHIDTTLRLEITCQQCGVTSMLRFAVDPGQATLADPPVLNASQRPSDLIDLGQWLALFRTFIAEADRSADRQQARRLGYEAALCIEEALKFYEDDNELPPDHAFFSDQRRQLARSQPAAFARSRLLDLRSKLPTLGAMARTLMPAKAKRWWQWWR